MSPENKKLAYIGAGLAGAFLAYKIFFADDQGGSSHDPTGNGDVTNPGSSTGSFNARRTAEALYEAMRETGTDEGEILFALRHVNQQQFGEVVSAFGRRSYNATLGNQINYSPFFDLPLVNLQGWLKSELSQDDYAVLRMKYPMYL